MLKIQAFQSKFSGDFLAKAGTFNNRGILVKINQKISYFDR